MTKITKFPDINRVRIENDEGEVLLVEDYEFVEDLEKVVDFLRLDWEVVESFEVEDYD